MRCDEVRKDDHALRDWLKNGSRFDAGQLLTAACIPAEQWPRGQSQAPFPHLTRKELNMRRRSGRAQAIGTRMPITLPLIEMGQTDRQLHNMLGETQQTAAAAILE
jgi:hypothetical protein